jgi:hypothetical protein
MESKTMKSETAKIETKARKMKILCIKERETWWGILSEKDAEKFDQTIENCKEICEETIDGEYALIDNFDGAWVQDNTKFEDAVKNY